MKSKTGKLFNLFVVLSMALSILATPTLAAPIKADVQSAPAAPVAQEDADAKLTPALVEKFSAGAADYIVHFKEQADLSAAYQMDWEARGAYVYNTLKETAERSQAGAKAVLDGAGLRYQTFIAGNELYVWGGTLDTARAVAALPEVEYLRETRVYHIDPVVKGSDPLKSYAVPNATPVNREVESPTALAWGIDDTQADQFWSAFGFQGDGIVVANIDTGVDYTHDALEPNYKCGAGPHESCWLDPGTADCTGPGGGPCDTIYFGIYHGSHTMGTMVADDNPALLWQAGMAPNAQWIACLGCPFGSCPDFDLNTCADWMLAPGGDPNNRPNIVNNSWGGGGGDAWYLSKVNAWRAAGIFPAFSAGNSGPSCNTLGSPGDYQESFGSAAHDVNRVIADFSSRGPSLFGDNPYTKPNLSAPGVNVISTQPGDSWTSISGTSMASPHTAGAVALLWSCNPSLVGQIDQTFQILQGNTDAAPAGNCGAPPSGEGNYTYGYGYLNVYEAGLMWCGPTGTLTGAVTDAVTSAPIPGATVFADGVSDFTGATDANGVYTMTVAADTYDVTASKFGYVPQTVTGVVVPEGGVVTQDFALTPAPSATVSGYVYDSTTGWALYARIDVAGVPDGPFWTDPVTGYYEISLPTGSTYDFTVSAWVPGYLPSTVSVPVAGPTTQDFPLDADLVACNAPGYNFQYDWYENFEGDDGGFTVSGAVTTWQWGMPTSGPGAAHSGVNVWATNLSGNYLNSENGYITSPLIDLSGFPGASLVLDWYQWARTESNYDYISVEVSNNGGASWSVVYGPISGVIDDTGWARKTVVLPSTYAVSNFQMRFHFTSDSSVVYPGWYVDDIGISAQYPPPPTVVYSEDFDATDGGYTHSGTLDEWEWGVPSTAFPGGCYNGSAACWDTDLDANYENSSDYSLYSPVIDLSGVVLPPGTSLYLKWAQAIHIESATWDHAYANASINGGAFATLWTNPPTTITEPWAEKGPFDISSAAGGTLQLQYRLTSDSSVNYEGWTVDDVQVYYAEPWTPSATCVPSPGGLVVGNVYDENTNDALTGAMVENQGGFTAMAMATPADPNVDDAFYTVFSPAGSQVFTATIGGGYLPDVVNVNVAGNSTTNQDFYLGAGWLVTDPTSLQATLSLGESLTQTLSLANLGAAPLTFEIRERDQGMIPTAKMPYPAQSVEYWDATETAPASVLASLPDLWGLGSPIPTGSRYRSAGASCDGSTYYIFGGQTGASVVLNESWQYDPASDTWTALAPMPVPLMNMDATCIDGLIYLVGGYTGSAHTNNFQIYDTSTNTWTLTTWPNARTPMTAAWNGMLYAFGGNPGPSNETWMYDPGNGTWTMMAPMPTPESYAAAVTVGDYIFYVGGPSTTDFQRYDPAANVWDNSGPNLPAIRMNGIAVWYGDLLYVASGGGAGGDIWTGYNDTLIYDPAAWPGGSWATDDELVPTPVVGAAHDCVDNRIFAAGGTSGGAYYALNQYLDDSLTCNFGGGEVPWLSVDPTSGTLPPGSLALGLGVDTRPLRAFGDGGAAPDVAITTVSPVTEGGYAPQAPQNPSAVLWDQPLSAVSQAAYVDQDFSDFPDYSSFLADDFTNPAPWSIETIFVPGDLWNGGTTLANADMLHWEIYADAGGVPDGNPYGGNPPVWSLALPPTDPQVVLSNGSGGYPSNTTLNLATPLMLPPGTYWFIFYPTMSFATGGQYGRQPADTTNGYTGQFINPGGGFGLGTDWQPWSVIGATQQDIAFRLEGAVVPAGMDVTVTYDASVVGQPGEYHADLVIANDTPYGNVIVPVTMTVTAPTDWGKLEGTVSSLGYCDVNPAPVEGAEVLITTSTGMTHTLTTNPEGYYITWLPESESPVTIRVTAPEHTEGYAEGVVIVGGQTTTVDFDLRWLAPCVSAEPTSFSVEVPEGFTWTENLTLFNTGAGGTDFEVGEQPVSGLRQVTQTAAASPADARRAPDKVGQSAPIRVAQPADVLFDQGFEDGVMPPPGWSVVVNNPYETWGIANFQPHTGVYHGDILYDPNLLQQDEWIVSPEFVLSEATVSLWSYGSLYWCRDTFDNCDLNVWIVVGDVGGGDDIYVGTADADWPANWTYAQSVFDLTPLLPSGPIRLGFQYEGLDGAEVAIDDIVLEGVVGSLDVPWLSESPISGTLGADSSVDIEVTFDTLTYTAGTELTAFLKVKTDDLNSPLQIPVTMTVVAVEYGVEAMLEQDAQSGMPGETVTYTVMVTNTGNVPDTFDVAVSGNAWATTAQATVGPLAAGESATVEVTVEIPADAADGDSDAATVTFTSQGDPTKSAAVTATTTAVVPYEFGVTLDPASDAKSGSPGAVVAYALQLTNTGDITDTFDLTAVSAGGWTVALSDSEVTLGAGESAEVTVYVTIPADAADGDSDVATVTATSQGDDSKFAVSELTTTAVYPRIYLPVIPQGYNAP